MKDETKEVKGDTLEERKKNICSGLKVMIDVVQQAKAIKKAEFSTGFLPYENTECVLPEYQTFKIEMEYKL